MCAYKIVRAKFEVWGFQSKVEAWTQKVKKKFFIKVHILKTFITTYLLY